MLPSVVTHARVIAATIESWTDTGNAARDASRSARIRGSRSRSDEQREVLQVEEGRRRIGAKERVGIERGGGGTGNERDHPGVESREGEQR